MGNCTNVTNDPLTVTLTAGSLGTFCHTSLQTTYEKFIEETTGAIAGDVAGFVSGDDTPASGDQTKLWFKLDGDDCHTPLGWYFYNGNLATPDWVPLEASSPSPIGTIVQYVADAAPTDWLLCDGAVANAVTYAALNTLLGTTYGTQGQTPDLQCRIPLGKGAASGLTARALNDTGGAETHTLTGGESGTSAHGHTMYTAQDTASHHGHQHGNRPASASNDSQPTSVYTGSLGVIDATAEDADDFHENMPPFITVNYIIRAL